MPMAAGRGMTPRADSIIDMGSPLSERRQTHAAANAAVHVHGVAHGAPSSKLEGASERRRKRGLKRTRVHGTDEALHNHSDGHTRGSDADDADATNGAKRACIEQLIRCPITLDVMKCPVFASDGHTYDAHAIESWLQFNQTSPVTREPMNTRSLRPNFSLRHLLSDLGHELEPPPLVETDDEVPAGRGADAPMPWPVLAARLAFELVIGAAFNAFAISHMTA
mmetsp:Transcript_3846/g.9950  ORF Transcript_3846/g.9950 Transcript_3846/m.9950 type:complete len:223 (-) Transcript_3846:306-974(-)